MKHFPVALTALCLWSSTGFAQSPAAPPPEASDAPSSPTTALPPPEAEAAAEACFPECRPGFLCHEGACISACNPACPAGTECTAERSCAPLEAPAPAPVVVAPPAVAAAPPPPMDPARREAEARRERIRAFRREHRMDLQPSLDASVRVHVVGDYDLYPRPGVLSANLTGGMAKNVAEYFGFLVRGNLALGSAALNSDVVLGGRREAGRAFYYGIDAEVVPYVGLLGSFYIGPLLTAGFHGYSQGTLRSQDGDLAPLKDRFLVGLGGAAGLLLGPRRNVHVQWFMRTTFSDWMPWQLGFGVGYRFGLGSGPIE